jgi:hypothetical protein
VNFIQGRFQESKSHFDSAVRGRLTHHTQGVVHLFLGRCLDLEGQRERALEAYQRALSAGGVEPRLLKALKDGLKKPYRDQRLSSLHLDLQFPDAFAY